ncbi:MAG: hypothetical protein AB7L65_07895 [Hyphomonadaceae bacterium]
MSAGPALEDAIARLPAPWAAGAALYAQIEAALAADPETRAIEMEWRASEGSSEVRWAPGAIDSLFGAPDETPGRIKARQIIAALNNVARQPSARSFAHLYALLLEDDVIHVIDQILPNIAEQGAHHRETLAALARRLAKEAPDAEPVKAGLALLGVFGEARDADLIARLGRHDEFTVYSVVALSNLLGEESETQIWALAKQVHGWGRIQAVERLRHTQDAAIKAWMLREGFRNDVADGYLACLCARAGALKEALEAKRADAALLMGAADLFDAMLSDGPGEGVEDYAEAGEAASLYLDHLTRTPSDEAQHFLVAQRLIAFVNEDSRAQAWPAATRFAIKARAGAVLKRSE